MPASAPHIPVLRAGAEYESLDQEELVGLWSGEPLARVSRANAGLVRRDLAKARANAERLRALPAERLLAICHEAGERFLAGTLPVDGAGATQSPEEYVEQLSATTGLPHTLCRANMRKIHAMLTQMPAVLRGLTRGIEPGLVRAGYGEAHGLALCFAPVADTLGAVLPSNSPGVNSLWLPAIALGVPVVLKPGRQDPWTPLRIARALQAAGAPREALSFYPADHEGGAAILAGCDRSLVFGDAKTTAAWAADPRIEVHGPGWSKVLVGPDEIERWPEHLETIVSSVLDNGGRSCVNASAVLVPSRADELADALARRLATVVPRAPEDPQAQLAAFADPRVAEAIDAAIERGLAEGGAEDVTARYRQGPRLVEQGRVRYLLPTVVRCASPEHPLARAEYLFPFASVVELPAERIVAALGHSLVVSAITRDELVQEELLAARGIDRLNLGPVPTTRVDWDQPHEGNLFELLYRRRAIRRAESW